MVAATVQQTTKMKKYQVSRGMQTPTFERHSCHENYGPRNKQS